jgi:hypothetical protein
MKTIAFLWTLVISVSTFATDKFTENMQKYIAQVYAAETPEQFQPVINAFDRIAQAEPAKWEPLYYSAFGNLMVAVRQQEAIRKDQYLDLALATIEKAKKLQPAESEIIALEGFAHMIRVTVDPATRGQQYSGLAMQTFGKAIQLNPANPRALCLMAQMQFGTAQFFGASTVEACATGRKAVELFEAAKSENPLAPSWGKEMAQSFVASCK